MQTTALVKINSGVFGGCDALVMEEGADGVKVRVYMGRHLMVVPVIVAKGNLSYLGLVKFH